MKNTDRIEKQVDIAAPPSRVWKALTDSAEFSRWFNVELDGPFVVGKPVKGVYADDKLPPKEAIAEIERSVGLEPAPIRMPPKGTTFCTVEKMEPEKLFSFRWIPYGLDASIDLATEPTTLVEFRLEPHGGGTRLTITESGFDRVPAHRRTRAFRMNDHGWTAQAKNIQNHVQST